MLGLAMNRFRAYRSARRLRSLIGRGLTLGRNVQIEGECFFDPSHCFLISVGDDCRFAPGVQLLAHESGMFPFLGITRIGRIEIREKTFIGMSAIIFPGVRVGPRAIVGAHAVVVKDVPPDTVVAGNPARTICSLEDYLARHRRQELDCRKFPEAEYRLGVVTAERRREMIDYLERERFAYMQGVTPDVSVFNKETPGRPPRSGTGGRT